MSLLSNTIVIYSCGSCGYNLNLSSSNRNTTNIGSKYGKAIKKGLVSFFSIDESRFLQVDELRCHPYFDSKRSWGLLRKRTKLFCRKCENFIGIAYAKSSSSPENGDVRYKMYDVKINALQPSEETIPCI
ncbi:uncharacterized protein At4g08330, chloroplastic-like [Typha latifolia]|uniref:uncharacterized protein At4g08330, chloroplastic-like n=1 Tax=Typha latifolia TaxID=4733 RepID=UPI003C2CC528